MEQYKMEEYNKTQYKVEEPHRGKPNIIGKLS